MNGSGSLAIHRIAGVELVSLGAVLVQGDVPLRLVTVELDECAASFHVDDLLKERSCGGPDLMSSAPGLPLRSTRRPRERLGGVAVAPDGDAAVLGGQPT